MKCLQNSKNTLTSGDPVAFPAVPDVECARSGKCIQHLKNDSKFRNLLGFIHKILSISRNLTSIQKRTDRRRQVRRIQSCSTAAALRQQLLFLLRIYATRSRVCRSLFGRSAWLCHTNKMENEYLQGGASNAHKQGKVSGCLCNRLRRGHFQ